MKSTHSASINHTRLLKTAAAAEYLSISQWKLRKLIAHGSLPIVRDEFEGPFLIDRDDLDKYIEQNKHTVITPM
jgi:excisionase family DNA binding protein